ncbi:hypothetical protein HPB47_028032 [Ixodes persulcatus]|uniref:Uncharacterized protein n=1 Tax=Ixodes persulcatus TaxID=34615 RepID=A0AC60PUD8_IXOPE|nr:hypothetical protein HPB47_028032 [Ixodes persulcatus]
MTEGDEQKPTAPTGDQTPAANPNAVDISPKQDGGVLKEIIKPGVGEDSPQESNTVYVHYTGKLLDGTVFDSSRTRGEKFEFVLGKGNVIKAWDIGVATMKKGEVAILTCSSEYAYGKRGSPPKIPADATLIFEVELFDWKLEDISPDSDGSIQRKIITAGELYTTPKTHAEVKVHLLGRHEGRVFEDRELSFVIGEGSEHGIVRGVETGLQKFKKGEKSLLRIAPSFAFGAEGNSQLGVPPNANVEYEVTLKSFENAKESWEMDTDEKIEQADLAKNKGTLFLKAEKYQLALDKYKRAVDLLEHEDTLEGEKKARRDTVMLANYLNVSLCHLRLKDTMEVIKACNKALELDPRSEKALFRRGQAHMTNKDFDEARSDFEQVLQIDANNKAAKNQLTVCAAKQKEQLQRERQMYKNMFERMAAKDAPKTSPAVIKPPSSEEPLEPGVWNKSSEENNQEPSSPEESKTAEAEVPPESVPTSA